MRTRRLSHRSMATAVSHLRTMLIHIARVTGQFVVRLKLFLNGNCPFEWNSNPMFYSNPLLQNAFILTQTYFKKYLDAEGNLGSDGWARVNHSVLGSFKLAGVNGQFIVCWKLFSNENCPLEWNSNSMLYFQRSKLWNLSLHSPLRSNCD